MALIRGGDVPFVEPPGHERGFSRYLVGPEQGSEHFDFRLSRYPAGGRVPLHSHEVAEQIFYFIEGAGVVVVGDETHHVGPEDTVFALPGVAHSVDNPGPGDLVFVVVTTPPEDILR